MIDPLYFWEESEGEDDTSLWLGILSFMVFTVQPITGVNTDDRTSLHSLEFTLDMLRLGRVEDFLFEVFIQPMIS